MTSIRFAVVWIARIASLVSLFVLSAFILGGDESLEFLEHQEIIGFMFFPVGVMIGMIVGWMEETIGGWIGLTSLVAFYIWHTIVSGVLPTGPWFLIFSIPVILFVTAGFISQESA